MTITETQWRGEENWTQKFQGNAYFLPDLLWDSKSRLGSSAETGSASEKDLHVFHDWKIFFSSSIVSDT